MDENQKIIFRKNSRAQANMQLCIGIALGIQALKEGDVDPLKSYYHNAIDILNECDDELLKEMSKHLQGYFNECAENFQSERDKANIDANGSDNASAEVVDVEHRASQGS